MKRIHLLQATNALLEVIMGMSEDLTCAGSAGLEDAQWLSSLSEPELVSLIF